MPKGRPCLRDWGLTMGTATPASMMNWLLLVDEARLMRRLFPAAVESVEEVVLNALCRARTVVGRDGHTLYALPLEEVAALVGAGARSAEASR